MLRRSLWLAVALVALAASSASAQLTWTAVASTGTIDESALAIFAAGPTQLGYTGASVNPIVARYNVVNLAGVGENPPWGTLELGYFDNAVGSTVAATLFQVTPCTGAQVALCTVTSVDNAAPTCRTCTWMTGVNFANNLYYVELKITRNNMNLLPLAYTLRIF